MTNEGEKIRPFCCGSQFADWVSYNCQNCKKQYDEDNMQYHCDIEEAIGDGYVGDGTIPFEIWKRMGGEANKGAYNWECPEKEVVE